MDFSVSAFPLIEKKPSVWFQAKTVKNQFSALSHHIHTTNLFNELLNIPYFVNKISFSKHADQKKIESLLLNSRNTEYILRSNNQILEHVEHACVLQWAFPQAYYSVFNSLRALYHTLGYTEADKSHALILKKFASLAVEGKLPKAISFYSDGGKKSINYHNIVKPQGLKPMSFSLRDSETVHNQICQFLKSTREQKLDERKDKYCLESKKKCGKEKKFLTANEWDEISAQVGPTTIMDLLYRKRIKSNYGDVDPFISEEFEDGPLVLECICNITYQINYIFEIYICRAMGPSKFEKLVRNNYSKYEFAEKRLQKVLDLSRINSN